MNSPRLTDHQRQQVAALHARLPDHYGRKFFDGPDEWLTIAAWIAKQLRLDGPSRHAVLDIGCGAGYFVAACKQMGNDALGFDMDEGGMKEAAAILGAPYIVHRITAEQCLPPAPGVFDVITMSGVNLRLWSDWGWDEHIAFTRTVLEHVRPAGRFVILPHNNPEEDMMRDAAEWQRRLAGIAEVTLENNGLWLVIAKAPQA